MNQTNKPIVGTNTYVNIDGVSHPVAAKVDTGADGTSIWASGLRIGDDDSLFFRYFDPSSPLYDGREHRRDIYKVVKVTSSTGDSQIRFQIKQKLRIGGKNIVVWCNLSDRSKRTYPMLIGKRTLKGRFLVDVSISEVKSSDKKGQSFHEKFLENPDAILNQYRTDKGEV
jgi:hypothetical protein